MASSLSSKKRIRQNEKRRSRNRWRLRALRTTLKDLDDKFVHAGYEDCSAAFKQACKILDRTAGKGVIHKNTAARKKSRLSARLKAKRAAPASR